ncbi:5'/3'-nucleotidase SurE [Sphingomonas sp. NCPPB 2930]|uniref:5'/3'-nucleotidase SurE n=1 Tax=Sphingomonas sp. NCPPB 2930 TaxID=3162788 RepID=UPI0036DCAF91
MRILLTNDDGYHAPGLAALERIAATLSDDVWIVAPAEDQSGTSRSLTLTRPMRLRQFGERRFAVTGTPTDSVLMALGEVMADHKPDLILSGVNRGANLGEDVFYSGTVAAAMEGALAGIRSIALSQRYPHQGKGDAVSFATAEAWGERVLRPLLTRDFGPRTLVNVNFPPVASEAVKGIRATRQGLRDYGRARLERRSDPRGYDYYWLALGRLPHQPGDDTDLDAIADDHIAVTPLHLDLTHQTSLAMLDAAYR